MVIRTRLTINVKPIQDEVAALNAMNEIVQEAGEKTERIIKPQFLAEAQYYPPPAKLPFEFNTEKSRRWYFAAVKGLIPGVTIPTSGGRYRRTGKLKDSFFVRSTTAEGTFEIIFGSTSDVAKWVVGSFDRRRVYQVRGHRNTGWQLIAPTADFWADAAEETFLEQVPLVYASYNVGRKNR